MKTERSILIAFILNLSFAAFELVGGIFTGSVAIMSDSLHDLGDAFSIGISYFLEKKSKRPPDETYTFGYTGFSVLGSIITTIVLLFGSIAIIANAIGRLFTPIQIHYDGMILFAVAGLIVNACAAFFTRSGDSLNQKAVNLHMLEDVLGWVVVLVGALIMRFTHWTLVDPLMSIALSAFILISAAKTLNESLCLILMKTPHDLHPEDVKKQISKIDGVLDVHHIHLWSIDTHHHYATMHIVTNADRHTVKQAVRTALATLGIGHATLELESEHESCAHPHCRAEHTSNRKHQHPHH